MVKRRQTAPPMDMVVLAPIAAGLPGHIDGPLLPQATDQLWILRTYYSADCALVIRRVSVSLATCAQYRC